MNILQFCNKIPYPVIDGGTVAMHQLSQLMLQEGNQVQILAVQTHKRNFSPEQLTAEYQSAFSPKYVYLDTRVKWFRALLNLFSSTSYNIQRFDQAVLHQQLISLLKKTKMEVVVFDSLFVTPYLSTIRKHSNAKIILRAHNVEHQVWERFARNEKHPIKKWYLNLLAKRLKKYELEIITEVDGIAAISKQDEVFFRSHTAVPVEFVPFCFSETIANENDITDPFKLYFLGTMDWKPNREALNWLLKYIVPELKKTLCDFQLTVAGTHMPEEVRLMSRDNFHVLGQIDSPDEFVKNFSVLVAPLFSGGGLKIKVVEAMAHGKLVITTPIGAEGIGATNGTHLFICNHSEEFLHVLTECRKNPQLAAKVANAGREFILKEFGQLATTERLKRLLDKTPS